MIEICHEQRTSWMYFVRYYAGQKILAVIVCQLKKKKM
jgi:hypothetical protein